MKLLSDSLVEGAPIAARFALGKPDPANHVTFADNVSPHLAWQDVPEGTRSFALLFVDVDVPSRGDDVNKEGRVVPSSLPRVNFHHLALVDVPADRRSFADGELSRGVVARGKPGPEVAGGMRAGLNDYTGWFAGDATMEGQYFGYDGPCPPWNDARVHRYFMRLYALDVARCPVERVFTGPDVERAIKGHVLAAAAIQGTYAIYAQAEAAW
jgi:hypothetical protein